MPRKPNACSSKRSNATNRKDEPRLLWRFGLYGLFLAGGSSVMDEKDRVYFARRAAEEQELAAAASDPNVARAHQRMQRAYLERATAGARPEYVSDLVG